MKCDVVPQSCWKLDRDTPREGLRIPRPLENEASSVVMCCARPSREGGNVPAEKSGVRFRAASGLSRELFVALGVRVLRPGRRLYFDDLTRFYVVGVMVVVVFVIVLLIYSFCNVLSRNFSGLLFTV